MRTHLFLTALTLTTLSLAGAAAANDATVDLTISGGNLNPTQNTLDERISGVGSITAKHGSAPGMGGRVSIWINEHFALEGTGFYAGSSSLEGDAFGTTGAVDVAFFYGSGRAVVGVGNRARFLMSAGLATMARNFDTDAIEDGSLTVGVVGAGLLVPLGNAVSLRFDLDGYFYSSYWEFDGIQSDEILQHDVVLQAGLTFHMR
jgi:hypothetical protein